MRYLILGSVKVYWIWMGIGLIVSFFLPSLVGKPEFTIYLFCSQLALSTLALIASILKDYFEVKKILKEIMETSAVVEVFLRSFDNLAFLISYLRISPDSIRENKAEADFLDFVTNELDGADLKKFVNKLCEEGEKKCYK